MNIYNCMDCGMYRLAPGGIDEILGENKCTENIVFRQ